MSNILAEIEPHKISIKNDEKSFNEDIYIKAYTIHKIVTLSEDEYSQEKLDNNEMNPLYYYKLAKDS